MQYTMGEDAAVDVSFATDTTPFLAEARAALASKNVDAALGQTKFFAWGAANRATSMANSTDPAALSTDNMRGLFSNISRAKAYFEVTLEMFGQTAILSAPNYTLLNAEWDKLDFAMNKIKTSPNNPIVADAADALMKRKQVLIGQGNFDPSVFSSDEIAFYKAQAKAGTLEYQAHATVEDAAAYTAKILGANAGLSVKQVLIAGAVAVGAFLLLRRR